MAEISEATFEEVKAGLEAVGGPDLSRLNREEHCQWFQAKEGDDFVGCLLLDCTAGPGEGGTGMVTGEYVTPPARSAGVAQQLVDAVRLKAEQLNLRNLGCIVPRSVGSPKRAPLDQFDVVTAVGEHAAFSMRDVQAAKAARAA